MVPRLKETNKAPRQLWDPRCGNHRTLFPHVLHIKRKRGRETQPKLSLESLVIYQVHEVILLGCFLAEVLSLLHLAHVSAANILVIGAIACAIVGTVFAATEILPVFAIRGRSCAILTLLNVLFWQPLTLHVCLDPEVGEEHEEEGSIHPDEVDDHGELVVAAVHKVILCSMKRYQDKLDLLGRNQ